MAHVKPNNRGQALVEFTLIFVLFLVVAWIPADFGLFFYTGQLALNASREGARIAAADRTLGVGFDSCDLSSGGSQPCSSEPVNSVLKETAERVSSALLSNGQVQLRLDEFPTCNQQVHVTVTGNYTFFFYPLLELMGVPVPANKAITRETTMRWEHQESCNPVG